MAEPESGAARTIVLEVFRYLPEAEAQPRFQRYEVPFAPDWVVLDALNYIKDHLDGTLSYRWSCRMGICGSCGMMVNGEPRLTCAAFLREYSPGSVRVEPLAHFPVIRDLVINLDAFMDRLREVKAWLIPRERRAEETAEYLQTPEQLARYKQFSLCINCMLCYAACPVYGLDPHFIGPAALALAHRYNNDSRDGGWEERTAVLMRDEAVWECTFVGQCSVVCPKHVDPAGAIQQAKLSNALEWYRSLLLPWGRR
jgi:fumarate reductase iron-sulfur subunit